MSKDPATMTEQADTVLKCPEEEEEFSPEEQRKIIHRIDRRLIIMLGFLHTVALIDRGNVGTAAVAGMMEELKLVGTQYSTIAVAFFPPYICLQPLGPVLVRKLGPVRYLTGVCFIWGAVMLSAGFVKNWSQMVGIRIIIGALEAGFFPASVYLIGTWYTRYDIQKRYAVFYLLGCVASAFTGILSYGITHMNGLGNLTAWRWIFIMQGLLTTIIAFIAYFVLVDFPDKMMTRGRGFLSQKEYEFILRRIERDRADTVVEPFNWRKYLSAGLDLHIWAFGFIYFCTTTTAYAISYFLPLIYREGMGFSMGASLCLFAPPYAAAGIVMYVTSWAGDRWKIRGPILVFNALLTIVGLPLIGFAKGNGPRLLGAFLITMGANSNAPAAMAYQANNVRGQWKRAICSAIFVGLGASGGMTGSLVYRSQDAPTYHPGYQDFSQGLRLREGRGVEGEEEVCRDSALRRMLRISFEVQIQSIPPVTLSFKFNRRTEQRKMADLQPSFSDRADFENASRGLVTSLDPCIIRSSNGRVVYDNDQYAFLRNSADCPSTVNPKLWRQGQLTSMQGLFEVTRGIYQVRGLDLANMTIVEGTQGVIIIDPLTSVECAAAALDLYRGHRGPKPVTGVIYSHSHIDHFGGARGVLPSTDQMTAGGIPILAPEGFMEEALSENIYVGPAMRRRAVYMYGNTLPASPQGQIGCGIGMAVSSGTTSLVPPNDLISATGEQRMIDGVRIQFQLVPETEAPAEMNFYLPAHRALYIAECATHCLHNIITLRGAQVRDAKAWARYLDEALILYGETADVLFAGHNWPTWGKNAISQLIAEQRDLYGYLHDQTVRLMNRGMTGIEIAEILALPPALQTAWHAQGFYGSVSHNVKGIYQRYMGWFDGNPAHLWEYPPAENARRYVACMGGLDEVLRKANTFAASGDLRFAATLLGHVIVLDPNHPRACTDLASVFEKLGFGAENSTWRNFYLTAAQELRVKREKRSGTAISRMNASRRMLFNPNQAVEHWWALLSVSLDGPKAASEPFTIDINVTDEKQWRLMVSNGVLTYRNQPEQSHSSSAAGFTLSLCKSRLQEILGGSIDLRGLTCQGDEGLLFKLISLTSS